MVWLAPMLCFILAFAAAQTEYVQGEAPKPPQPEAPTFSSELLDPAGLSRFHLVTRATFSNGESVFSSGSAWSSEARAHLRITEGLALSGVLPIGFYRSSAGAIKKGFVGNIAVGIAGGKDIELSKAPDSSTDLRLGAAIEVYLPSAPSGKELPDLLRTESFIASIRPYEPNLYLPRFLSFRTRVHADIVLGGLVAGGELGVTPGWTVEAPSQFALLFSGAARASFEATHNVEPYLEMSGATQIAGKGDIRPPFLVTPGVRFHIAEFLDPAFFVSFNFVTPSAIIFGLDIASAIRSTKVPRGENREDFEKLLPPAQPS